MRPWSELPSEFRPRSCDPEAEEYHGESRLGPWDLGFMYMPPHDDPRDAIKPKYRSPVSTDGRFGLVSMRIETGRSRRREHLIEVNGPAAICAHTLARQRTEG